MAAMIEYVCTAQHERRDEASVMRSTSSNGRTKVMPAEEKQPTHSGS